MTLDAQVPAPRRPEDGRVPASGEAEILGRHLRLAVRPAGAVCRVLELTGLAAPLRLFGSVREAVGSRR